MQLIRYNPTRDLQRIERDLEKFWGADWNVWPTVAESPLMDMYEENGKLVAEVTMPNFTKNEIKVNAEEGILEISAEHHEKEEDKTKRRYYFRESSNQYLRRVMLPEAAVGKKAEASFKDGTLRVTIPMAAHKPVKTIAVK